VCCVDCHVGRGLYDETRDTNVIIHVNSRPYPFPRVAANDVVRQVATRLEAETRHVFLDYHYFKLKALEVGEPDVRMMPKRIAPQYASETVHLCSCQSNITCLDILLTTNHIILMFV